MNQELGVSGSRSHRASQYKSHFKKDMKVSHLFCLHTQWCFAFDTVLLLVTPRPSASFLCAWAFAFPVWNISSHCWYLASFWSSFESQPRGHFPGWNFSNLLAGPSFCPYSEFPFVPMWILSLLLEFFICMSHWKNTSYLRARSMWSSSCISRAQTCMCLTEGNQCVLNLPESKLKKKNISGQTEA